MKCLHFIRVRVLSIVTIFRSLFQGITAGVTGKNFNHGLYGQKNLFGRLHYRKSKCYCLQGIGVYSENKA
jgi:hypothetical protein